MKTVLCYGDSNTWGFVPNGNRRYGPDERWPGLLRTRLPEGFDIIEEGQPGRTTVHDDPFEGERNGLRYLVPCLESHLPDLVVLLLGTNDLKAHYNLSAWEVARGAGRLVEEIQAYKTRFTGKVPQVLLVCPPPVLEVGGFNDKFRGAAEKSLQLAEHYRAQAEQLGCVFFDAGSVVKSCPNEGVHWQAGEHRILANALAPQIIHLLS